MHITFRYEYSSWYHALIAVGTWKDLLNEALYLMLCLLPSRLDLSLSNKKGNTISMPYFYSTLLYRALLLYSLSLDASSC